MCQSVDALTPKHVSLRLWEAAQMLLIKKSHVPGQALGKQAGFLQAARPGRLNSGLGLRMSPAFFPFLQHVPLCPLAALSKRE